MNLAEFFASESHRDDGPGLTDDQIITRMGEWFAQAYEAEPEIFRPGQIIWHKNPSAAISVDSDKPHLFVRYLETAVRGIDYVRDARDLGANFVAMVQDCEVMSADGNRCPTYFMDSRCFTATRPPRSRSGAAETEDAA